MKKNAKIEAYIQDSINKELSLHAEKIQMAAKNGLVSLVDVVDSYVKKKETEIAVKKVIGSNFWLKD